MFYLCQLTARQVLKHGWPFVTATAPAAIQRPPSFVNRTMPWNKIDHEFKTPELDYNHEPNYQKCIKVSVFFKKLESIDFDTFFGHWQTVHADLATATQAFKDNIVRYVQVSLISGHAIVRPSKWNLSRR